MSKYEVSIVTPYHNIDLDVFKNGFNSIKNQTLGFENIEWIIVLHNCEDKYIEGVREMSKDYENVKTYILNNDVHSASSPRNYGIELATSRYIGFLDGDDSFTPWCLKTVLNHMKKSGAEVTWFRREYELESKKSVPVTEIVLWDQTREEIIIEKDSNWDDEKIFSAVWGLVTSRMYDLDFIRANGIKYDETVKIGEDYLFNFEVYGRAKRLCYLPQTIGYHYYINGGSTIQKGGTSEKDLIEIAKGLKKIYDCGLKYGFYMDATIGGVTFVLVRLMMGSTNLTVEGRREIKNILAPYVEMIKNIKPSKIYTEKAAYDRSVFLKDYILNPEKWADGQQNDIFVNSIEAEENELPCDQRVLSEILEANAGTDMGKRYDFRSINTLKGFQAKVPEMNYDSYAPLIALNTRIGESGIFVSEPVTHYVYFTGSYGDRKLLPVTASHLRTYVQAFDEIYKNNITFTLYENVSTPFEFNDKAFVGSIFGAVNVEYYKARVDGRVSAKARFTTPESMNYSSDTYYNRFIKCLLALENENLTQICGANMRSVMNTLDFILKNASQLIECIETGQLKHLDMFKEEIPEDAITLIRKDEKRAECLKNIFSKEFTLKDIWPKLKRIVADGTGDYALARRCVEKYAGNVVIDNGPLARPDAMFGKSVPNTDYYELNIEGAFYEFREVTDNGMGEAHIFLSDLEVGHSYRVYVTNKAGLYRFDSRLLISIISIGDKIVFEVLDNSRKCTEIGEVDFYIQDINKSMAELGDLFDMYGYDYVSYEKDDRISILLEVAVKDMERLDIKALQSETDKLFAKNIRGYKSARDEGRLEAPELSFIEPETNFLYLETKANKLDVVIDAIALPHFLINPKDIRFFEMAII